MQASRREVLHGLCGCGLSAMLAGCVGDGTSRADLVVGHRPESSSLEGGLWQIMERAEAELKHSPLRITDARLDAYVSGIACRLAGEHCPHVRVYIMRTPFFNASMAPNGMMQVWSGLLLRCQNEAQLAAVLGHEIGHYTRRHTLQRYESLSDSLAVAAWLGIGLAMAGAGAAAGLPQLAALANALAFSRDQEREADDIGLDLMARNGYAPIESARIWEALIAEQEAGLDEEEREKARKARDVFFATHPQPEERAATLAQRASERTRPGQVTGEADWRGVVGPLRDMLMEDELRLQQYRRTLVITGRMRTAFPEDAAPHFYEGEVYRQRNDPSDGPLALAAYGRALEIDDSLAGAWRGVGIVHRRAGRAEAAAPALQRYLDLAPAAPDRLMIRKWLGA